MTIELPQPRRQSRSSGEALSSGEARSSGEVGSSAEGWSPADELAALETVWASLCQDAASPAPTLELPVISRSNPSRAADGRPQRQRQPRRIDSERIAS